MKSLAGVKRLIMTAVNSPAVGGSVEVGDGHRQAFCLRSFATMSLSVLVCEAVLVWTASLGTDVGRVAFLEIRLRGVG